MPTLLRLRWQTVKNIRGVFLSLYTVSNFNDRSFVITLLNYILCREILIQVYEMGKFSADSMKSNFHFHTRYVIVRDWSVIINAINANSESWKNHRCYIILRLNRLVRSFQKFRINTLLYFLAFIIAYNHQIIKT